MVVQGRRIMGVVRWVAIVRATTICRRIIGVRGREEKMSKKREREIVVEVGIEVVAFQRQGCDPPQ